MTDNSSPDPSAPEVISHYRLETKLGSGGMGAVYRATDRRDDSVVAIKVLHAHLEADETFRERFEREAHVAALLRSPYTVHVLDYGFDQGRYFIAMEFVEGQTLREAIRSGPMDVRLALQICGRVARALEEAEARGVVHRDIKPENILLGTGDAAKVSDFGIARQVGGGTLTMPGAFLGTLAYAAPELALGKTDNRSDIYSLGATLYHALAGQPPFRGEPLEVLRHHADTPVSMEPLESLPEIVVEVVSRCLEKEPDKRYQSASDLASDLERAARAVPTPAAEGATEVLARTEVVETETAATEVAPSAGAAAGPGGIALGLGAATGGLLGGRLGSARYDLTIRNEGDAPATVQLQAGDEGGSCSFSIPTSVSVPARGSASARVGVGPRRRRWGGRRETRAFTVSASQGGGAPPVTVSGLFEDVPLGWLWFAALLGAGAVVAIVLAMLLLGGEDSTGQRSLAEGDLPLVVLPASELGEEFSSYIRNAGLSGLKTNGDLIAGACDPDEETRDVSRLARINGFDAFYRPQDAVEASRGVFIVQSSVELFDEPVGAQGAVDDFMDEVVESEGTVDCNGTTIVQTREFPVGEIGDGARGVEVVKRRKGGDEEDEFQSTFVVFALAGVMGKVAIADNEKVDRRADAEGLARSLHERIQTAIDGELGGTPTPLPTATASPASPGVSGSPTATPTATPTGTPAGTATPAPTATTQPATPRPTAPPTAAPTQAPTPAPTAPPVAPTISSLGCSPTSLFPDETVNCTPSTSGQVTSRSWSATGGSPSSGSGGSFSTSYSSGGSKTITLTACNGSACASKSQTITVVEIIFETYDVFIDDAFDVPTDEFVTVNLWADVPASGLGYYDIDVTYDTDLLTAWSCTPILGDCDPDFDIDTVNFEGEPFSAPSGFLQIGSITFLTGFTPGASDLFIFVFGMEDADGFDVTLSVITFDGLITIQ
jgi:serine/threonine-protein kinase